jgi:hypothetical protein
MTYFAAVAHVRKGHLTDMPVALSFGGDADIGHDRECARYAAPLPVA